MVPPESQNMHVWEAYIERNPKRFGKKVRQVVRNIEENEEKCGWVQKAKDGGGGGRYQCDRCEQCFKKPMALRMHQQVVHGVFSPIRSLAGPDGVCGHCMRNFHQRRRLQLHFSQGLSRRGAGGCAAQLVFAGVQQFTAEQCAEFDALDRTHAKSMKSKGRAATYAVVPYQQGEGPMCPIIQGALPFCHDYANVL